MIRPYELAMRHGEKDNRGELTDDGEKTIKASTKELVERFNGTSLIAIHTSSAKRDLETAKVVTDGLKEEGFEVTVDVAALLDPSLPEAPSREALLRYLKLVKDVGMVATTRSGLLVVGRTSDVVELARLDCSAEPGHGEIFPIEYPDTSDEDESDGNLPRH